MRQVNQLIHATKNIETLKSILKDGLHTSYAKEEFCGENILIPMISFSNILFRDMGENEVIDYGNYAVVIDRDSALEKYKLNPVMYVTTNSDSMAEYTKINYYGARMFITEKIARDAMDEIIENITGNRNHIESRQFIEKYAFPSLKSKRVMSERISQNSLKQKLLMKPYKVKDKKGREWIAYNDREWRKSFFDLSFIKEFTLDGKQNEEYTKWENTLKPHFKDEKYTLRLELKDINHIVVEKEKEISEIETFIREDLNYDIPKGVVDTLENLKKIEMLLQTCNAFQKI